MSLDYFCTNGACGIIYCGSGELYKGIQRVGYSQEIMGIYCCIVRERTYKERPDRYLDVFSVNASGVYRISCLIFSLSLSLISSCICIQVPSLGSYIQSMARKTQ